MEGVTWRENSARYQAADMRHGGSSTLSSAGLRLLVAGFHNKPSVPNGHNQKSSHWTPSNLECHTFTTFFPLMSDTQTKLPEMKTKKAVNIGNISQKLAKMWVDPNGNVPQ